VCVVHDCRLDVEEASGQAGPEIYSRRPRLSCRRLRLLRDGRINIATRFEGAMEKVIHAEKWPKVIHAIEVENRLGDEIEVKLQTFPHGKGWVLKLVVHTKGDPVGLILPNAIALRPQ
jgi:hypothetical protein